MAAGCSETLRPVRGRNHARTACALAEARKLTLHIHVRDPRLRALRRAFRASLVWHGARTWAGAAAMRVARQGPVTTRIDRKECTMHATTVKDAEGHDLTSRTNTSDANRLRLLRVVL